MQIFLLLAFVIAVTFVIITFQNPSEVTIQFINWTFTGPFAVLLAVPFAAGMLTGIFLIIPLWWKKAKQARARKKRTQELESELLNLTEQLAADKSGDEVESHEDNN